MHERYDAELGILGGGISGLIVADLYSGDSEVLEAEAECGGLARSLISDGYTFDVAGPHILFSKNAEALQYLIDLLGDNVVRRRRENRIFFKNRYVKYPFENDLAALPPEDIYECLYHYLQNDSPEPTNFREWLYYTFGKGIAERYLIPYNEKIWKIPCELQSFGWADGRVPKPPLEDVLKSAVGIPTEGYTHQLYFSYPRRGGYQALVSAAEARAPRITREFRVRSVRRNGAGWLVGDGQRVRRYRQLISTIPVMELLPTLEQPPPPSVRQAVARLRYNALYNILIGVRLDAPVDYTAVYYPDPAQPFHRVSFMQNFSPDNAPPGHAGIMIETSAHPADDPWAAMTDDDVIDRHLTAFLETGFVRAPAVTFRALTRNKYAYVVQDLAYEESVAEVRQWVESQGVVLSGRFAEMLYINTDGCYERAQAALQRLKPVAAP